MPLSGETHCSQGKMDIGDTQKIEFIFDLNINHSFLCYRLLIVQLILKQMKKNRIQILSIIKLFFGAFKAKDVWDHIIF